MPPSPPPPPPDERPGPEPAAAERPPGGLRLSLRAALNASAQVGFAAGVVDSSIALAQLGERAPDGLLHLLGCFGAATLWYGLGLFGLSLPLVLLGHRWLAPRDLDGRSRWLIAALVAVVAFFELYWWSRPWVFSGLRATSPPRLVATAGMVLVCAGLGWGAHRLLRRVPRGAFLAVALVVPLFWICGIFFLIGDLARAGERGALNERNRDLPNVLLVVVDALRSDVLEPYGSARVKTPHLAELAERGTVFENAFAQAPFTWSSFGSILTGKYPLRHGLISMKPGIRMADSVTLAHHLKNGVREDGVPMRDEDWASATFMTGTLSNDSGLMRGFDAYSEMMDGHDLVDQSSAWSVFRSELLAFRVMSKARQVLSRMSEMDAGHVVRNAVGWLRHRRGHRWVAMVHLYSTHTPYDPRPRFRAPYEDPGYAGPIRAFYADARIAIEQGEYVPTTADEEQIKNLYYGGTMQADARIGEILAEIGRLGMLEDTLVIVTSDHGEELGDHGLWEHNWMYQTNLRIPLVMAWPGHVPAGQRVDALVETIDILPTVCDLIGLRPPEGGDEYAVVDGVSLVPLLRGETESVRDVSFSLNASFLSAHDLEWKLILKLDDEREEALERVLRAPETSARLFHLAEDPGERVNLLPTDDPALLAEARRLAAAMREWRAGMPIPYVHLRRTERDDTDLEILRALGYVDGIESPLLDERGEAEDGAEAGGGGEGAPSEPKVDE